MPDPPSFPTVIPPPSVDPTHLTTEALRREIELLEMSVSRRLESVERELNTRLENGASLRDEKLAGVEREFALVERQRQENKLDTKLAVDAALQAQKEAVREQTTASERAIAKSETATNKQLEQLSLTFATSVDGLRRSIDEVKERQVETERTLRAAIGEVANTANSYGQQKQGGIDARTAIAWAISAILALITIGSVIAVALKP